MENRIIAEVASELMDQVWSWSDWSDGTKQIDVEGGVVEIEYRVDNTFGFTYIECDSVYFSADNFEDKYLDCEQLTEILYNYARHQ